VAKPLRQRGQTLAFVALVLPLVLLPVAGYAVEASRLAALQARLQEVTALAAMDAAQQLDVAALRAGAGLQLDPPAAAAAARASLSSQDPDARLVAVEVSGAVVNLGAEQQVPLVFGAVLPAASVTLKAAARARLRAGFDRPV